MPEQRYVGEIRPDASEEIVAGWMSKVASRQAGATRAARAIVKRCQGAHWTRPLIFRSATMSCCRNNALSRRAQRDPETDRREA
jgi:hypothetical protein